MWSLARLLDWIFPRHPIGVMTPETFVHAIQDAVNPTQPANPKYWSFAAYKHSTIRSAIWEMKYNNSTHAANLLAHSFAPALAEHIADTSTYIESAPIYIIPIPTDIGRTRIRGIHHLELLCRAIMNESSDTYTYSNLLVRTRKTHEQTKQKTKEDRLQNLIGSMQAKDVLPNNAHIIVIDDVITTGATMCEASRALIEAGYTNFTCVSVAH